MSNQQHNEGTSPETRKLSEDSTAARNRGHLREGLVGYTLPVDYNALTRRERRSVREEYVRRQDGKCSHCGSPLTGDPREDVLEKSIDDSLFPTDFLKWPVHLHHCHKTGMTIGAVHSYCNAVLWQYHGE